MVLTIPSGESEDVASRAFGSDGEGAAKVGDRAGGGGRECR